MKLFRLMALLLIGCQWHIANAASPMPVLPQYKMVDLGTLQQQSPTMSWVFANGLNQHGVVVGDSTRLPEHTHAARWPAAESQPEVVDDLGAPIGATSSTATAINDHGTIVGFATAGMDSPLIWSNPGGMQPLGDLPGGGSSGRAMAINNEGLPSE